MAKLTFLLVAIAFVLTAQQPPPVAPPKPLQGQSFSTFTETTSKSGQVTYEVRNASYHITGEGVPGLPGDQRLLLRVSTRARQVKDEIGMRASVLLEAWPLGSDPKSKPIYASTISPGTDAQLMDDAVWVVSRGTEEVDWWSVLKLATTAHLFDTYVPVVHFSISRETLTMRYAGFDVPPDDVRDVRLKEPHVVGVLEYASADQVIREALITCDDTNRAALLRSYADSTRTLTGSAEGLTLSISQNYPSPPDTTAIIVPIANDNLDLAHAKLSPGLRLAAWTR